MASEVQLDVIIEALEMADDSISSYLDVETGEVHSITEEEFYLAEDPQTAIEDLPNWQCEAVKLARSIQEQEGKRYLALPGTAYSNTYSPNTTCGALGIGSSKSNFGRWPSNGVKRTVSPSVRLN